MFDTNLLHHVGNCHSRTSFRSVSVAGRFRGNGLQDGVVIQADPQHCDLAILTAMNPKNSHNIHMLLFDASHCIRNWIQLSWFIWFGGLILNQISNTCLEVAAPCYNVNKITHVASESRYSQGSKVSHAE